MLNEVWKESKFYLFLVYFMGPWNLLKSESHTLKSLSVFLWLSSRVKVEKTLIQVENDNTIMKRNSILSYWLIFPECNNYRITKFFCFSFFLINTVEPIERETVTLTVTSTNKELYTGLFIKSLFNQKETKLKSVFETEGYFRWRTGNKCRLCLFC